MTEVAQSTPRVQVISPDGKTGSIPLDQLKAAKDAGFTEPSLSDAIHADVHAEEQRRLSNPLLAVPAAIAGAGRAATFGGTDVVATGLANALEGPDAADETRRAATGLQEEHGLASTVGELGGMFLTPGLGAAGKGAAGLATRIAGQGATTIGKRAVQAGARYAAQGAAEMALLGAGDAVSEEALGDPDANAEKLLIAGLKGAGRGAITGAAIGGVVGGLGGAVKGAFLNRRAGNVAMTAGAEAGVKAAEPGLAEATEAVDKAADKTWADRLTKERNEMAIKAAGFKPADWKKPGLILPGEDVQGAIDRLGPRISEKTSWLTGKAELAADFKGMAQKAEDAVTKSTAKLNESVHKFDVPAFASAVRGEVIGKLARSPNTMREAETVGKWLDDAERLWSKEQPTYEEIQGVMRDPKLPAQVKRPLEIQSALDEAKAAKDLGADFERQYMIDKAAHQDFRTIADVTKRAAEQAATATTLNVGDQLGSIAGAMLSRTGGGIVGGMFGGIPGAIAGAAFNKALRTYGNQIATTALDRASKLSILSGGIGAADKAVAAGVDKIAEGGVGASSKAERLSHEHLARIAEEVKTTAADQVGLQSHIRRAIGRVHEAAPSTAAAMAVTTARAIQYLSATAPVPKTSAPSLTPFAEPPRYAPKQLDEWAERLSAVEDPVAVLDEVLTGRLSRAKIETLREVYPKLYQEMQSKVALKVAGSTNPLSWERQKALAIFMGIPTSPMLTPEFIGAMQATKPKAPSAKPGSGGGSAPHHAQALSRVQTNTKAYQTPSERIASR